MGQKGIREIRELKKRKTGFSLLSLPSCLSGSREWWGCSSRAALLPIAAQTGDESRRLGWAAGGDGEGTLQGFGSALIRVIITAGTQRHTRTHTHTGAGICCWRQSRLLWFYLRSEVITCPALPQGEQ